MKEVGYAYQPDMVLHVSYGNGVPPVATECPSDLECPTIESGQLVPAGIGTIGRVKAFAKRFGLVFYGYYAWSAITTPEPGPDATKSLYSKSETTSELGMTFDDVAATYVGYVDALKSIFGSECEVAFIYLPYSFSVHPGDIVRFPGLEPKDVPLSRERIRAAIDAIHGRGVPILDTLPALTAAADRDRLYYWLDIHFTPNGNRVVGRVSIPFVQRLIDRSSPASRPGTPLS